MTGIRSNTANSEFSAHTTAPEKRVTGAGAHTESRKRKEEGEVQLAPQINKLSVGQVLNKLPQH